MTSKARSTERRRRAAETRDRQKAREDRVLKQIVTGCVALVVLITLGVGYAVLDANSSQRPATTSPTTPARPATTSPTTR